MFTKEKAALRFIIDKSGQLFEKTSGFLPKVPEAGPGSIFAPLSGSPGRLRLKVQKESEAMRYFQQYAQVQQKMFRRQRGCRRYLVGCLLIMLLLLLALAAFSGWFLARASAASPPTEPLAIYLLIDNSDSMFPITDDGADPEALRLAAARLFVSYLGLAGADREIWLSPIYFGSEPVVLAPLLSLQEPAVRETLLDRLSEADALGWTDQAAALRLALTEAEQDGIEQTIFIMLSDGRPEATPETPLSVEAYETELAALAETLAEAGIPLHFILLNTTGEPDAAWSSRWQSLSGAAPGGQFHPVMEAEALFPVLLAIVRQLVGNENVTILPQLPASPVGARQDFSVPAGLAQLTLVIRKSDPTLQVEILRPDGGSLAQMDRGVLLRSQVDGSQEIWTILTPPAGSWTLLLTGTGSATVWVDQRGVPESGQAPVTTAQLAVTVFAPPAPAVTPTRTLIAPAGSTPLPGSASLLVRLADPGKPLRQGRATLVNRFQGPPAAWWLLPAGVGLALTGVALGRQYRRQQMHLSGSLRLLNGPPGNECPPLIHLEPFSRRTVRLGASPAEIHLPGAGGCLELTLTQAGTPWPQIEVHGGPDLSLDSQPLAGRRPLHDAALLTLGQPPGPVYCFRYENLQLRLLQKMMVLWHATS